MIKKTILKGTYCLIIQLRDDTIIEVGKKGSINFKKGYYVYVGSALNSLETRLKRHLSSKKKTFLACRLSLKQF
jgi:Uri superfamily endonuclease